MPLSDNNESNGLTTEERGLDELETFSTGSVDSSDSLLLEGSELKDEIQKRKKYKRGVVYISFIPPGMTPPTLRRLLSQYATIERMFLQAARRKGKEPKKSSRKFTEGWIEFLKKRDAKKAAAMLNNTPIGGKRKSKFREYLWNLKYLPRFKWIHLTERLNYERAAKQQRLRAEVNQARKVANHFAENVDKEERLKKRKDVPTVQPEPRAVDPEALKRRFKQRELKKGSKEEKKKVEEKREDFLKSLFS